MPARAERAFVRQEWILEVVCVKRTPRGRLSFGFSLVSNLAMTDRMHDDPAPTIELLLCTTAFTHRLIFTTWRHCEAGTTKMPIAGRQKPPFGKSADRW